MLYLTPLPNTVTEGKTQDYYISYTSYGATPSMDDTTSMVLGQQQWFLTLNGDHSKQLGKCESLEECLIYFRDNIGQANKHSEHAYSKEKLNEVTSTKFIEEYHEYVTNILRG